MDELKLQTMAKRLRNAYGSVPIKSLRGELEGTDQENAYAVQQINTEFWTKQGRSPIGYKIGLTSKSVQKQLGVDQPDFGVLFDDMQVVSGGSLSGEKLTFPKAEAEIAFVLGQDIQGEHVSATQLKQAVRSVHAAIEIVDSRIADWNITFADTVSDNGSSAFFVLGDNPLPISDLDLWSCGMVLEVSGEMRSHGVGAACLGHPVTAAMWLANTMLKNGQRLRAGDVLLTGALGPMVDLKPGSHIKASIGGIGCAEFYFEQ